MKVLVTGGAGFIGSAVCRLFVGELNTTVLNVDKLTYAANLSSLRAVETSSRYAFRQADICDRDTISQLLRDKQDEHSASIRMRKCRRMREEGRA